MTNADGARAAITARPSKIRSRRVADALASELRRRILRDGYDGSLPKQDTLVQEFGVSYPSVREALRILEAEGLITVRRGNAGGALIRRPDATSAGYAAGLALEAESVTLRDLAEALLVLEPLCASLCARRDDRGTTVVPLLRENLAATEAAMEDDHAFTATAREFHEHVVSAVGNRSIRLTVRSLVVLWSAQENAWAETLAVRGEYFAIEERADALRAHEAIADAIQDGDATRAESMARRHLAATQRLLLARFDDEVIDASSTKGITT